MDSAPVPFQSFAKIARLNRECIATEKIDGTNGCIYIPDDAGAPMLVGSRSRWITPTDDNFGFARWAYEHEAELRALGPVERRLQLLHECTQGRLQSYWPGSHCGAGGRQGSARVSATSLDDGGKFGFD